MKQSPIYPPVMTTLITLLGFALTAGAPARAAMAYPASLTGRLAGANFGLISALPVPGNAMESDFGQYTRRLRKKASVWGTSGKVKNSHSSEIAFWFAAKPYQARCYGGRLYSIDHKPRTSQEITYNNYRAWKGDMVGEIGWLMTISYRVVRPFGNRFAVKDQRYRYELGPAMMVGKINGSKYSGLGISALLELRPNRMFIFRMFGSIAGSSRKEQQQTFGNSYGEHTSFSELGADFSLINWWKRSQFAFEFTVGYRATFDLLRSETILTGLSGGVRVQW